MADPALFSMTSDIGFSVETSYIQAGFHISTSPSINQIAILGRSAPLLTYAGSNPIVLSFTLDLYAESDERAEVVDVLRSFIALTKPMVPGIEACSLCHIEVGNLLTNFDAVLASLDMSAGARQMWFGTDAGEAAVNLQFIGVELENVGANEYLGTSNYKFLAGEISS